MKKRALILGSIFGLVGVALGAFGAHGLKEILIENGRVGTFETAVSYQMYHALMLLICGLLYVEYSTKLINTAIISFATGIIIFSGSLYILSLTGVNWLGAITPIGGVFFIAGWICLLVSFFIKKPEI
jgi:uncharacterized membrane protein YgdD (TMEM256/DUF423 family)